MLQAIGARSLSELFDTIPAELRLNRPLNLPAAMGELELTDHVQRLAARNHAACCTACFLGAGCYDHFVPALVDFVASRSEFYTAYTPYQPEASQGSLQAMFEYQTLVTQTDGHGRFDRQPLRRRQCRGRGGVVWAVHSSRRSGRVVVARSVHPEYRQVLATYLAHQKVELVTVGTPEGTVAPDEIGRRAERSDRLRAHSASELLRLPRRHGRHLADVVHKAGALLVVSVDPISLGLLKRPGQYGADIVVAEGQTAGHSHVVRRTVSGPHGLSRRVRTPHAGPTGRSDRRPSRASLLGAHPADPRAAHSPRKSHQQHLHQPRPYGLACHGLPVGHGPARDASGG